MTRSHARPITRASAWPSSDTGNEAQPVRRLSPEVEARMHELARRNNEGRLTLEERREFDRLVELASEQMLMNARALLYDRDPASYAAAVAEERGGHRRATRRTH